MRDVTIDPADSPERAASRFRRVAAATRALGEVQYVCRVGWETPVQQLEGSAGAVWLALEQYDRVADIAAHLGVAPDDEFLIAALDLLADAGLVEIVPTA